MSITNLNSPARIIFCGPIPLPGDAPTGGYEACNSRTIAALRAAGNTVQELRYPQPRGGAAAKLSGYWRGFRALLAEIGCLRSGDLLHMTGLYKQFVVAEYLMLRRARRQGLRTVYDVRAGSMLRHYSRLGSVYRWLFRKTLRCADLVMIEGMEYASFVETHTGRRPFYLPNHVGLDGAVAAAGRAGATQPRLIYVGRITVEKGIEIALESTRLLARQGLPCTIAIVGLGDAALLARLRVEYADVDVEWLGPLQASQVLAQFGRSHFFMFPTRHTGEGHSNALTEALATGCVPIAAENGFNLSVIGTAGRVLPLTADAEAYARAVRELWEADGQWAATSTLAARRALELFSTDQVIARLQDAYAQLLKDSKR